MKKTTLRFDALEATQGPNRQVAVIRASAEQIHRIAAIERLGRDVNGRAIGFQRPQVSGHIAEIRDYLEHDDAVLPNALVLAFVGDARLITDRSGKATFEVDVGDQPPGFVVDGQQRLTALTLAARADFQVFASVLICRSMDELRRQFILINNTKPLPKSLIYELLPTVGELPERLNSRSLAAKLTERLNFESTSSLHQLIKMQTNPTGVIKDTALQKAILNSQSAGAIQIVMNEAEGVDRATEMVSNFYRAVSQVFPEAWEGQKPTTSRLVHGAGIVAMGFVMDEIFARNHAASVDSFVSGLQPLRGKTAWTEGQWKFSPDESIPWNRVENTSRQIQQLSEHLVSLVRHSPQSKRKAARRSA